MKDPLKSEIRRILLGYLAYDENQHLVAAKRVNRLRLLGLLNGTGAAGVLGVAVRRRCYSVSEKLLPLEDTCRNAFAQMGRRVSLDAAPERLAVFYTPLLFNPSVLTAEQRDEQLEICVYTARTLTVRWNAAHAFRKWKQNMPDELRGTIEKETRARPRRKARQKNESGKRQKTQSAVFAEKGSADAPEKKPYDTGATAMKSILVPAAREQLEAVQAFVEEELATRASTPKARVQLSIAVEEIFVNIASYAYDSEAGDVEVCVEIRENPLRIVVRFLDQGKPFDPLAKEDADTSPEALERRVGGLGILIVKKSMDAVTYSYENGKNILTIEKKLN